MGFFSALTGKSQAKTLKKSKAASDAYLQAGRAEARGNINEGYAGAESVIQPYLSAGQKGFDAYNDAIGINGLEGYGRAKTMFDGDPFAAGEAEATNLAIRHAMRSYNANGLANSGTAALGTGRIGAERYGARVNDFRNRLQGVSNQGQGTAQFASGLKVDRGNALANLNYGYGQQRAGQEIGYGNALSSIQSQGANNMLNALTGGAGLALKFAAL